MEEAVAGAMRDRVQQVRQNVERVIVGKSDAIEMVLVALLCEGHVLIEDVPGLGKTMLVKSLARSLGCTFHRIQCTPDLLPSDITGTHVFNQKTSEFEFHPGPVQTQLLLVDEINRATPRTQSSLLECMEERQVTVEGETLVLPRPFMVLATQNPVELEGTFPLPEAQLDRFLLKVKMGYPTEADEHAILQRFREANPLDTLEPAVSAQEILEMQRACRQVRVHPSVEWYMVTLVRATREHPGLELGASPRAALALFHTSQALAMLRGRDFVVPDDVKGLAPYVLSHRLMTKAKSRLRGHSAEVIIADLLLSLPVPVEQEGQLPRPSVR